MKTDSAGLADLAGTHLGYTDWRDMSQERVDQFADATDDHQFMALIAPISRQLLQVSDVKMGVNYGLDRVRFPAPLPVGAEWRGGKGSEKPVCVAESLVRLYG